MIVWINGAFGVGKRTTAGLLTLPEQQLRARIDADPVETKARRS